MPPDGGGEHSKHASLAQILETFHSRRSQAVEMTPRHRCLMLSKFGPFLR